MAPGREDYYEIDHEYGLPVQVHRGPRILPDVAPYLHAWVENEKLTQSSDNLTSTTGENRLLFTSKNQKPKELRAGPALRVEDNKQRWVCPRIATEPVAKSKFQKNKERFIEVFRPPYFIITMIVIIVSIHFCVPEMYQDYLEWTPGAWRRQPWRLLTYGLVHADTAHLAFNALLALAVGWRLEIEQGWARAATVWAGGLAAGALGVAGLQPGRSVVGASAAIYALLTAHLPNVCLRFGHIQLWWFRLLSVAVLVASEVCADLLRRAPTGANEVTVAWAAHALGAAAGIPMGFIVFTGENVTKTYIKVCRALSGLLLVLGVLAAAAQYFFKSI